MKDISKRLLSLAWLFFLLLAISACSEESTETLRSLFVKDLAKEREKEKEEKAGKIIAKVKRRADGTKASTIRYKDGIKHGMAEDYYENGKLRTTIEYREGLRHGEARLYHKDGKLYRVTEYENDQKNGLVTIYRKDGQVKATIPYKDDQPGIGTQEYYVSGKPKTEYPEIIVKRIDQIKTNGRYSILVELSEKERNAVFYSGKLTNDKYIHKDLVMLMVPDREQGILSVTLPPNTRINETVNIVVVAETSMGNPYIAQKAITIDISN
jgi:antitoxin component YwqK of YwqJK toxin-antitoxin module